MLISEQLIARHLQRGSNGEQRSGDDESEMVEVFNILTLEEWAKKAETEDMPVAHAASAADSMHGEIFFVISTVFLILGDPSG